MSEHRAPNPAAEIHLASGIGVYYINLVTQEGFDVMISGYCLFDTNGPRDSLSVVFHFINENENQRVLVVLNLFLIADRAGLHMDITTNFVINITHSKKCNVLLRSIKINNIN